MKSLSATSAAALQTWAPALLVHDAAQLAAALVVAAPMLAPDRPLPLVTAPEAAAVLAPDLQLAMLAAGSAGIPVDCIPVVDCGAAPGHALEALRAGAPVVVLSAQCPAWNSVRSVAAEMRALLMPAPPPALDLRGWRASSAFGTGRLRAWLAGDTVKPLR